MAQVNLFEFTDILQFATEIGYTWNDAHRILDEVPIRPMYELKKRIWYVEDFENQDDLPASEYSYDVCRIMREFFKTNNLDEITVI